MKRKTIFVLILTALVLLTGVLTAACVGQPPPSQPTTPPPPPPPAPVVEPVAPPPAQPTYNRHTTGIILDGATAYKVNAGDTLSTIAKARYQDDSYYPLILMVSGSVRDCDVLSPGMDLTIPALSVNLSDSRARQAMNTYFATAARTEEQRGRPDMASRIRRHVQ